MQLTEPIVFIRLSYGLPGRTRKISVGDEAANSIGADRKRLRTVAKLFSSEAFSRITAAQSAAKSKILTLAIPIPLDFDGVYVVPRALLDRIEKELLEARERRDGLIESFIANDYALERDRAQRELGSAFDPNNYPPPSILRDQFSMKWRYFSVDIPEELPPEVKQREVAKLEAEIQQVAIDCRRALREGLSDLVGHLVERLTPDSDGKPKRLSSTTVSNLNDFLATISLRDITGDTDIRKLAEQAKKVLGNVDAEKLRDDRSMATKIRSGLDAVGKKVAALVRTDGVRRFDFSDEEDADVSVV